MNWLQQNQPEFAASFLPGLNDEQINESVKDLQLQLPEEIYELYRWRNGTKERQKTVVSPTFELLPLEDAVTLAEQLADISEEEPIRFEGHCLFPFIDAEGDMCTVLLKEEKENSSPIISILAEEYEPEIIYNNLTSMMQTFAECYETNAYRLDDEGFLEEDEDKVAEILRKYNSDILERDDY